MADQKNETRCPRCGLPITPGDQDVDAIELDDGVSVWAHLDEDCAGEKAAEQQRQEFEKLTGKDLPDN